MKFLKQNSLVSSVRSFFGIDLNVFYTLLARFWNLFAGILTLFLIGQFLSEEDQGYYYIFNSIIALIFLVEMNLKNIIQNLTAHEFVKLSFVDGKPDGPENNLSRIASLIRKSVHFYIFICILGFLVLAIGGSIYLSGVIENQDRWYDVQIPFLIIVTITVLQIFFTPLIAILCGSGFITAVAKQAFQQLVLRNIVLWISLFAGLGLLAPALSILFPWVYLTYFISKQFLPKFGSLWNYERTKEVSWKKEILPLQSQAITSMVTNWIIIQFSTPLLAAMKGPAVAGQMGMSIALFAAIHQIGFYWLTARAPEFSRLIGGRNFKEADRLFYDVFFKVGLIMVSGLSMLIFGRWIIQTFDIPVLMDYRDRVVSVQGFVWLSIQYAMMYVWYSTKTYMQCYLKEPYFLGSIALGLSITVIQIISSIGSSLETYLFNYAMTTTVIVSIFVFVKFFVERKKWQQVMIEQTNS